MARNLASLALVASLGLALAPEAPAAFVELQFATGGPAAPSVTFGVDASLSGSIPVAGLLGQATPTHGGEVVAIAGGLLTFAFGPGTPDGRTYYYGTGTLTLIGTLAGHAGPETLMTARVLGFNMDGFAGDDLHSFNYGQFRPVALPAPSADLLAAFGLQDAAGRQNLSQFGLDFRGTPGGPATFVSASLTTSFDTTVPEPSSLLMLAIGAGGFGINLWCTKPPIRR